MLGEGGGGGGGACGGAKVMLAVPMQHSEVTAQSLPCRHDVLERCGLSQNLLGWKSSAEVASSKHGLAARQASLAKHVLLVLLLPWDLYQ